MATAQQDILNRYSKVAVVGAGVIGTSWTALFLAHGLAVVVNDPRPDVETIVRDYIRNNLSTLKELGLPTDNLEKKLSFEADLERSVTGADLVQENGPERIEFKQDLWARIGKVVGEHALMLSSSSAKTATEQALKTPRPGRLLVGHPFNPPHVIPLVEVVAGAETSSETVQQAMAFYTSIGKKPIHLRKEMAGHVANRLQAALYREVVYLIEQGVLDVADADAAVCWGPGPRWGVMGPNLLFHLGGGQGGIQHFMEHLSGPLAGLWKDLGPLTEFTPQVKQTIIDGVLQEAAGRSIDQLAEERDEVLLGLLALRTKQAKPYAVAPKMAKVK